MSGGRDDDATADEFVPEPDDVSDVDPDAALDSNWVVVDAPLHAARDDADAPETDETDDADADNADEPDETDETHADEPESDDAAADNTDDPEPETDDTDTDTDEPEPDQPETDDTDTDEPEPDQPETDDTDTDEPEPDQPETDDTDTDEPEPDQPETDDTDTDTDEDDTDTDEPEPDQPETDDTDEDVTDTDTDTDEHEPDQPETDEDDTDTDEPAEPVVPVLPSNRSARRGPSEPGVEIQMTRWDRPPPPHDWRFYVNRTGRTLITLGLLMFGFVAYQLWGTGIQTARAQNRLEAQFEEALAAANATPTTAPTTVGVTTTSPTVATSDPLTPTTATPTTPPATTTPPSTAPPTTLPIAPGRALARLEIPKIDKSLYVLPGVDVETLHDGPGHYPDTPLPGQLGNSAIAGHRTTSGAPFGDIDELEPGDELIVTMTDGDRFVYQVTESFIVSPSEYWVVRTDDPTVAMLTLTSCHPEYTARQRIIVRSVLKPAESAPAGEPTFYELDDDPDEAPTPTTFVDGVPIPVTVPGGSTPDDPTVTDTGTAVGDTGGDPAGDGSAIDEAGPDGLTAGWFEDTAAWPHVFGWGAACVLLALSASWLSRRFRSYLIGVALVTLPFVVTLFFFYENVNRLLPAGL